MENVTNLENVNNVDKNTDFKVDLDKAKNKKVEMLKQSKNRNSQMRMTKNNQILTQLAEHIKDLLLCKNANNKLAYTYKDISNYIYEVTSVKIDKQTISNFAKNHLNIQRETPFGRKPTNE